jgi:hypothetical protein
MKETSEKIVNILLQQGGEIISSHDTGDYIGKLLHVPNGSKIWKISVTDDTAKGGVNIEAKIKRESFGNYTTVYSWPEFLVWSRTIEGFPIKWHRQGADSNVWAVDKNPTDFMGQAAAEMVDKEIREEFLKPVNERNVKISEDIKEYVEEYIKHEASEFAEWIHEGHYIRYYGSDSENCGKWYKQYTPPSREYLTTRQLYNKFSAEVTEPNKP